MTKYWRSLEEYKNPEGFVKTELKLDAEANREVLRESGNASRRDFLKILGFSIGGAAVVASCKRPVDKAIPYLIKPEEVSPGMANYYASTYYEGGEYCSVLVKVRDGRPIKIEGNSLSPVSKQGTSSRVQASVLNLYDDARYKTPLKNNEKVTWGEIDKEIAEKLNSLKNSNKQVVLLTFTIISPSTKKVIEQFLAVYPNVKWVQYDAISASAILKANEKSFGRPFIPDYRFDKAKVIVSFGADFLGSWLSPVEYTKCYTAGRKLTEGSDMNRHYQFESQMSLTGSNADVRVAVKPSEEMTILTDLYNQILKAKGSLAAQAGNSKTDISELVSDLMSNQGKSIVVSGSNDTATQLIVNAINYQLGNYENTILTSSELKTRQGLDEQMENLVSELNAGSVSGIIFSGVNPVYNYPKGEAIKAALAKMELTVSLSDRLDETSASCQFNCPEPHFLEAWNDAEPKTGVFSLAQPTIHKLFDSRQLQETLSVWSGVTGFSYYAFLKKYWKENMIKLQSGVSDPELFWNQTLQKGTFEATGNTVSPSAWSEAGLSEALGSAKPATSGWEVTLYENVTVGNGDSANNPWLQELPDPIAKISWENFASVPVEWAEKNGVQNESVITVNGMELPVYVQAGQAPETIAVALGYGRTVAGKVGDNTGKNMYPMVTVDKGQRSYTLSGAKVENTGKVHELAISQTHHAMENRPIVRETVFENWKKDPASGNELREIHLEHDTSLYKKQEFPGHKWAMAVDLSACTGCTNCSVSCQAENNIPVIGKTQVRKRRIMHWIRIDRYFSNDPVNPEVLHQPVMCQHCGNAPCENVCPVSATPHSDEGLNQIAYNRCVGTKYCLNNCPYKVRRFNWFKFNQNEEFDYHTNSDLGRMVLNPDVVVRSRGVVEKCSFCVQRIQAKKALAKVEGRPLKDGEIQPACVQSCPADALVFGDINDPESKVAQLYKNKRNYFLLEELHTLPSVGYLTKVRNKKA